VAGERPHHQGVHEGPGALADHFALLDEVTVEARQNTDGGLLAAVLEPVRRQVVGEAEAGSVLEVADAAAAVPGELLARTGLASFLFGDAVADRLEGLELVTPLLHPDVALERGVVQGAWLQRTHIGRRGCQGMGQPLLLLAAAGGVGAQSLELLVCHSDSPDGLPVCLTGQVDGSPQLI
jgi:hypothetical protein